MPLEVRTPLLSPWRWEPVPAHLFILPTAESPPCPAGRAAQSGWQQSVHTFQHKLIHLLGEETHKLKVI